ncbi:hypothetical protein ACPA9J_06465 [Pseudomonas aeruginosa]
MAVRCCAPAPTTWTWFARRLCGLPFDFEVEAAAGVARAVEAPGRACPA